MSGFVSVQLSQIGKLLALISPLALESDVRGDRSHEGQSSCARHSSNVAQFLMGTFRVNSVV